jgi:hypothetical protein
MDQPYAQVGAIIFLNKNRIQIDSFVDAAMMAACLFLVHNSSNKSPPSVITRGSRFNTAGFIPIKVI